MNTTKLLCKYFDINKKGHVDGADLIVMGGLYSFIFGTLISLIALIGEVVLVNVLKIKITSTHILEVFTLQNIFAGVISSILMITLAIVVGKLIIALLEHKFVICERDIETKMIERGKD